MIIRDYDIIIIGGGHAGCEASHICAIRGYKTILITQNPDNIARMSCNPSIGGIAKGHLVKEIDALGGIMGEIIDKTMIQFRMLNTKKGPAVQAMRSQADKLEYQTMMKYTLEKMKNLDVFMDTVTDMMIENSRIVGVITERGNKISARAVILTTGTFMEGTIHIGEYTAANGRIGEPASIGLSGNLKRIGFTLGRLKTGTPPRVTKESINYDKMISQIGDPIMFSFSNFSYDQISRPNIPCFVTYTNEKTHEVIRNNLHRSPLFSGKIKGIGPRYCPSIEDKVKKFPNRERHQVFVEPEGLYTDEVYLNGLSSSLPEDVQEAYLKTIVGFEDIKVVRPAYAVEYDYMNPIQLKPSLETKLIKGLFIAGQTNGTSGYEEAGAQGIISGINASCYIEKEQPLILKRDEAYIGVLIDDLVTEGTTEPYRMFTSRAEYRLRLRQDNADMRLTDIAIRYGLICGEKEEFYKSKKNLILKLKEEFANSRITEEEANFLMIDSLKKGSTWIHLLKNPNMDFNMTYQIFSKKFPGYKKEHFLTASIEIKYEGYITRQDKEIHKYRKYESKTIPEGINYDDIKGLSTESREKLKKTLPVTLGQASRINGVRPSDISILSIFIHKMNNTVY